VTLAHIIFLFISAPSSSSPCRCRFDSDLVHSDEAVSTSLKHHVSGIAIAIGVLVDAAIVLTET